MDFGYEDENKKPYCPVVDVDGAVTNGKQFDLDITLPNDNRDIIFGVIKNCYKEPVADAVVKLIEIDHKMGKEERKPVSHTFTDKEGEFVFGPLCPGKEYAIQIWVDDVKHVKVSAKTFHEGRCLKGVKLDKCDKPHYNNEHKYKDYDKKPNYDKEYKDKDYNEKPHHDEEYKDKDYDDECKCKDYDKEDEKKEDKKEDKKDYKYNKYYNYR